jgi:hypothetical protein
MEDNLENFVNVHRSDFDDEIPSSGAWESIEKTIRTKRRFAPFFIPRAYKWTAAAILVCIVCGGLYLLIDREKGERPVASRNENLVVPPSLDTSLLGNGYAEQAIHIYEVIEARQRELRVLGKKMPQLYKQFSEDLTTLDSSYLELKTQAVATPGHEQIKEAIIENLQMKVALLNKQLLIIREFDNTKNQS